jgi:hypothetical protein
VSFARKLFDSLTFIWDHGLDKLGSERLVRAAPKMTCARHGAVGHQPYFFP